MFEEEVRRNGSIRTIAMCVCVCVRERGRVCFMLGVA